MSTAQPEIVLLGSMEGIKKVRKLVKIFLGNQTSPGRRRMLNPEKKKTKQKPANQNKPPTQIPEGGSPIKALK